MSLCKFQIALFVVLLLACLAVGAWAGPDSRLNVELTMPEVPVLGQEATVEWAVISHHPLLKDATLTIDLPKGVELIDGSLTWTGDLTAETKVIGFIKVKAVRPGNKKIRATIFARVDEKTSYSDVAQLFFHSDKGKGVRGRVLDVVPNETDTVMAATGEIIEPTKLANYQPGPEPTVTPAPCDVGPSAPGSSPAAAGPGEPVPAGLLTVTGKWYYYDRSDIARPISWVYVELLRASDNAVLTYTWIYDADGQYTFPAVANPGGAGFKVRMKAYFNSTWACDGNPLRVVDNSSNDYVAYTATRTSVDGTYNMGTTYIANGSANEPAWWVMMDLIKCFWWPYWFQADHSTMAGGVTAVWYVGSTNGDYTNNGGNIYLRDAAADVECIPMHEYGHAVQWDIYGGWLPPTGCPSPHYVEGWSGANCAWVEGFASWYKCVVSGDPAYRWPGGGSVGYEAPSWDAVGWDDGDGVEGRVTGAMWDMGDSVVDGYETCQVAWSELWDVVYGSTHRDNNFSGYWSRWKSMGKPKHHANKALFQNTIDYNAWPAFSGLPDRTTNEDNPLPNTINLWIYASDAESSDSELAYTITGNTNTNCGVSIDGAGYIDINPAVNWNGISDVTVMCSDGIRYREDTFRITVNAVADAPSVAGLPDKMLAEGSGINNAIDLWAYTFDPETADSGLTYTITGNTNTGCGVSIDSNRYIDINPGVNWNGFSDVTIRSTDPGGLWTQDTFRITVSAVNDPPVFVALPNYMMNEDQVWDPVFDLWAIASDVETPDADLVFSITGNTNTNCGASISSGHYMAFHPAANWNGYSDITLRVTDTGAAWDEVTFRLTVNPVNDPPVMSTLPFVMVYQNQPRDNVFDLWLLTSDLETIDSGLTFTITGNTSPSCGVSIDTNQYIDVNPALDWTGASQVTIRATDPSGAWDEKTFEIVVGESVSTIQDARNRPDGSWIILQYRPVTASFSNYFYIEENPSRTGGIRVSYSDPPAINKRVVTVGQMGTYYAERVINAHWVAIHFQDETNPPGPLGMNNGTMGGGAPNAYTVAVPTAGKGVYNVGLLVRTTGEVKYSVGARYYIADGSSVVDSRVSDPWLLVDSIPSGWHPPVGANVSITGISGASTLSGNPIRILRPRDENDIRINRLKAVYIYDTDGKTAESFKNTLDSEGIQTTNLIVGDIGRFNFSGYHVVIIGNDATGSWADPARVSAVVDSGLPIVALGNGGGRFLDAVTTPDLYMGWLNCWSAASETHGIVVGGEIYSSPYTIPYLPGDNIYLYYTPGVSMQSLYDPNGAVTHMIREYGDATHYPVAREANRFYMWGYAGSPSTMTGWGRNLFVNLIFRTLKP
ncbi:MAG: tandem-95 repeat protein [Armatimonadetes bacterium]|nr:tandem-95 repeat protein [Armatimonadota bacterium]